MARLTIATVLILMMTAAYAEYYDPMRPPPFALNKMRQEKIKSTRLNSTVTVNKKAARTFVLSSILFSRQRQHAIINDQLVKKGEIIDGAKLVSLSPQGARLMANGKIIKLALGNQLKKIKKSLDESEL